MRGAEGPRGRVPGGLEVGRRLRRLSAGQPQPAAQVIGVAVGGVELERAPHLGQGRGAVAGHVEPPAGVREVSGLRVAGRRHGPELLEGLVAPAGLEQDAPELGPLPEVLRPVGAGPQPHGPPGVLQGPRELALAAEGGGQQAAQPGALAVGQRGGLHVGLAELDDVVPAPLHLQRLGREAGDAGLLRVGRVELEQRAPQGDGLALVVPEQQGHVALDQQLLAGRQPLQQPRGRPHGRGGIGLTVAPAPAPVLDLGLLEVGLGEGRVQAQGLVEPLLGLLGPAPAAAREPGQGLDVLPRGVHRARCQPHGLEAPALGRQQRHQLLAQLVDGVEQLLRVAAAHRGAAHRRAAAHLDHLGREHEALLHAHERSGHEPAGREPAGDLGRLGLAGGRGLVAPGLGQGGGQPVARHDVQAGGLAELGAEHFGQALAQPGALGLGLVDADGHDHQPAVLARLEGRGRRGGLGPSAPHHPGPEDQQDRHRGHGRPGRPAARGPWRQAGRADRLDGELRHDGGAGRRVVPRGRRHRADRLEELVAPARQGLDVARVFGVVSEGLADLDDRLDQDVFRHVGVGPEGLDQLALRHHLARPAGQVEQRLEGLGGQRHDPLALAQAARLRVQQERSKGQPFNALSLVLRTCRPEFVELSSLVRDFGAAGVHV